MAFGGQWTQLVLSVCCFWPCVATGRVYPTTFVHKYDHDGKIEFEGKIRTLFTEENFQRFGEM